jgi:putative flavoprotein involved in K+ transport
MERIDAVVIGAGHAGLGVSRELAAAGVEHAVLERGRIAETWRTQRWDSFRLNTPNWMNRLPGEDDAPAEPRDAFQSAPEFVDRLVGYASRHRLPVHEGSLVTRVAPAAEGLEVDVANVATGSTARFEARTVIVASGIQNVARTPSIAAGLPGWVMQRHSLDYRWPDDLPDGAVLVVGSGQTGGQIVDELLDAGRRVYWSVSKVIRCPRRYRGRDMLEWLVRAGFYDVPLAELPDPALRFARQPLISGTGPLGHTISLQSLAARGASLVGRIVDVADDLLAIEDTLAESIRFGDDGAAKLRAIADALIEGTEGRPPAGEDDPADRPVPDLDGMASIHVLDLRAADVRTVIWATGVGGDFGWLPGAALDADAAPVHEAGVTPIPGLFVTGFPWLTNRGSGIIYGAGGDARRIAELAAVRAIS